MSKPTERPAWSASQMTMTKKNWAALNDRKHPLTIIRENWDGCTGDVVAVVWGDDEKQEAQYARLLAKS